MLRIVFWQFVVTVVVAVVAGLLGGTPGFLSALFGGVCCAVPNGLFAARLYFSARKPGGANPMSFFIGEFVKIATTVALMGAVVWLYHDINWLAFIAAFIVVLKSYLILLFRRRS
ncbi:ATP synthase subunit I [Glaciimonas soli]|uniref:ATP synthase subunit I n=1 Tax=Glaciimonas soli TaxID=2590999 RepID=A0A843YNK1_9BURK|nr:ATP synthase subunit I [Glaciimonas soli]MQR01045.1 ATP synthase subunit I [Glaciimonas soli]